MDKINPCALLLCGIIAVIFVSGVIEGRGVKRRKHVDTNVKLSSASRRILLKNADDRLSRENIRCKTPGCTDNQMEQRKHRHRHGTGKNSNRRKRKRKNRKGRRKNKERKEKLARPLEPEDIMQTGESPSDAYDLAAYDQYYAGAGRRFDRLQRPPEADRLERRLRPDLGRSAHYLLQSMNRVMMSLKAGIQNMYNQYDFAFNSTRYTMMMGVRHELEHIADANHKVYDVVTDVSLLTKHIYMRAHMRGLTRPHTFPTPKMPEFKSFDDDLKFVQREKRLTQRRRNETQKMLNDCQQQKGYLLQVKERLDQNHNKRGLRDLVRRLEQTIKKLRMEFDIGMVMRKMSRALLTTGSSTRDDLKNASQIVRDAKELLRTATHNWRGNNIGYEEWIRRNGGGNILAPVSYTDLRRVAKMRRRTRRSTSRSRDISPAERRRLRPIINRAAKHARKLRDFASRISRLLTSLIREAKETIRSRGGGGATLRVQTSLLVRKLEEDIQHIHTTLDRLRILIGDEDDLRRRCEELDMGSGDWEDSTPIDCDNYIKEGSGNEGEVTIATPDADSDFVFITDKTPNTSPDRALKTFGSKLDAHVTSLREKSDVMFLKAQATGNRTTDLSSRWEKSKANIDILTNFVSGSLEFKADWSTERINMDRISERVKDIHERVQHVANLTASKTFQAIRTAERKVEEVRGSKGQGSGDVTSGEGESDTHQDYIAAAEATGKAQRNVQSVVTLTQMTPTLVSRMEERVSRIKSDISNLRNKVDKARLVLASMQMSVKKEDAGYMSLPLTSSESSPSLHTSVELCVRPTVDQGPLLMLYGNNSESYAMRVSSSTLTMTVYDASGSEIGEVANDVTMEKDKWYSVVMERKGVKVSLGVTPEDGNNPEWAEETLKLSHSQPPPLAAYIGQVPDDLPIYSGEGSWRGCLGGLRINGRSVGLMQKTSSSINPVPCDSHCSPSPSVQSLVFEGNGYLHFPVSMTQLRYPIRSVYFEFRTRQKNAFIMSVVKRNFHLRAQLKGSTLFIETTTPSEAIVLRSENSSYNDGKFHTLKIVYRDSTTYPEIEGKDSSFSIEATPPERILRPVEGILVGGTMEGGQGSARNIPLIGCVRDLQINDVVLSMSEVESTKGVHVGSCSQHNMWLNCVQFNNGSTPIAYGNTEDANNIVVVVSRGSLGTVLHYKKGDKFDVKVMLTRTGIEIEESVKSLDGKIDFDPDDNDMFVVIRITDDSSHVKMEYRGKDASVSYGSSGWFLGGGASDGVDYTLTIGGDDGDPSVLAFSGGIAQMIVGDNYLDLTMYIGDSGLVSCERPKQHQLSTDHAPLDSRKR